MSRQVAVPPSLESQYSLVSDGRRWRFEVIVYREENEVFDRCVRASRDGKVLWEESMFSEKRKNLPWGTYVKVGRVGIQSESPVIAIRGHTGIGQHTDTVFYSLVGDRMVLAGRPPSKNSNGPILHRGKKDEWVFDDYDWYAQSAPLSRVLYRLDENYKLRKVRSWKTTARVPDMVKLWF